MRDGFTRCKPSFTPETVRKIVVNLDEAGVPVIEVSHGSGFKWIYDSTRIFNVYSEFDLIAAAVETAKQAKIASLFVPGIGTSNELKKSSGISELISSELRYIVQKRMLLSSIFDWRRGWDLKLWVS